MANNYFDFIGQNAGEEKKEAPQQTQAMANVTVRCDADCFLLCDGEYLDIQLDAGKMAKIQVPIGQHLLEFLYTEDPDIKIEKEETSSAIKLEDAKFFDLVNNTLVELRLDLDKVNLDNELAEMKNDSKDNVSPLVNDYNKKDDKELDKTMVNSITLDDFKESKDNNISQVVETPKEVKSKGNLFPWLSYVFVVLLILVAIGGSLTFLVRQFK